MRRSTGVHLEAVCLTAFVVAMAGGCEPAAEREPAPVPAGGDNVLLITLDTTRADRIGCYGHAAASTPALDSLAARGALFTRAYSQVPITTPAHCSLLTGRYPREHGVRDNGRGALPGTVETLATICKRRGYSTGAFVSAFVLESRFGLARGFDVYDDKFVDTRDRGDELETQRTADAVTDRALSWLDKVKDRPFFGWVHYYDPHHPYEPPMPFLGAGRTTYDGEIAFMDSQISRILDWVEAAGLFDNTLIIAAGDHGESFGEHGEFGHIIFLYETNLHVPLIFSYPPKISAGQRVGTVVELVDVLPTVMALFGWKAPPDLLSRSLAPALSGNDLPPRPSYAESLHVRLTKGWAEQRSLTTDRWKFISTAAPELYDLASDPGERRDVLNQQPEVAAEMYESLRVRLSDMRPGTAGSVPLDAAARRALKSLGYTGGGSFSAGAEELLTPGAQDPKGQFGLFLHRHDIRDMIRSGEEARAARLLKEAARLGPESPWKQYALGYAAMLINDTATAIEHYEQALAMAPSMRYAVAQLSAIYLGAERYGDAIRILERAVADTPNDVLLLYSLAQLLACSPDQQFRNGERAITYAERACSLTERRHVWPLVFLGAGHATAGDFGQAIAVTEEALALARQQGQDTSRIESLLAGYRQDRACRSVQ